MNILAGDKASRYLPYLALLIISTLLYLPGIVHMPLTDRDEAHFAQASRQMLQEHNVWRIAYQQKIRFQKPPGINWLQAASVNLLSHADSPDIWPYRVPSALAAGLTILLLFGFTRSLCGDQSAFLASCLLAIPILMNIEAHLALIDASLLLSIVVMQACLWHLYHLPDNARSSHGWHVVFGSR